jgi:hypothetical protein
MLHKKKKEKEKKKKEDVICRQITDLLFSI